MSILIPPRRTSIIPPRRFDPSRFETSKMGSYEQLICRETWLPAYDSREHHDAMSKKCFPNFQVEEFWRCGWCMKYHSKGYFPRGSNNKHLKLEIGITAEEEIE